MNKTKKIPTLPINKTQERLYAASSDPTFEHETLEAMKTYVNTDPTAYLGQILYCKADDKHYRIAKGDNEQKIIIEKSDTIDMTEYDTRLDKIDDQLEDSVTFSTVAENENTVPPSLSITNLDEKIDRLSEQLEKKASKDDVAKISNGTPLFASSADEMTDTTKNYVNTTDRYLYIYSDGGWIKTNVQYQSTGIADDTVTKIKINSNFKTELEKKRSAIVKTVNTEEIVINNISLPYNVDKVKTLVLNCDKYEGGNITISSRNLFNPQLFNSATCSLPSVNPKLIVVKDNVIGIQSTGTGSGADVLVTLKILSFQLEPNTSYCFSAVTSVKNNSFGSKQGVGNFLIIGDGSLLMSVNDNNKKVFTTGNTGLVDIALNIQNAQTISGFEQMVTIRDLILAKSTELLEYTPYHSDFIDIIPKFVESYKYINEFNDDIINVDNSSGVTFDLIEYVDKISENKKVLVCFGDSITGVYYNDLTRDYPYLISKKTNLTVYNVGFGGARMGQHPNSSYDNFCMYKLVDAIVSKDFSKQKADTSGHASYPTRLNTLTGIDFNKVDYVTIAYGTNDWGGGHTPNKPIDNEKNQFDCTNYYGATRYVLKTLLQAYPHLKILLITPYFRYDYASGKDSDEFFPLYNNGVHLIQYVDALKEVGEEFKTPVLDMYRNMGVNKYNISHYFDGADGVHFITNGMNRIAEMIAGQLKVL